MNFLATSNWTHIIVTLRIVTIVELKFLLTLYFYGFIFTTLKSYIAISFNHVQRSSHLDIFCKRFVLKRLTKIIGKRLCQKLLFNKVTNSRPVPLIKWDSSIGVYLWIWCSLITIWELQKYPLKGFWQHTEHKTVLFKIFNWNMSNSFLLLWDFSLGKE